MAAKANIVVDQGTTFTTYLALTDDYGNAINLTGYTANGAIRKWYTSNNYVSFTTSISSPNTGYIYISLSANQTAAMWEGRYVYDIKTTDSFGNKTRVVEGILTITPQVAY